MKLRAACLTIAVSLGCVHFAHAGPPPLTPDSPNAQVPPKDPPPPPDPQAKEKSRAAFRKGVAQIKANDWPGARASFEEAYSLLQHPSILLNLGISRLKTGDPVLAEEALTKFLQEDTGAEPNELASARDALAEAKKQIGTIKITATPPTAAVKVDGNAVSLRANDGTASVRLKPGSHTVNAEADGYAPLEQKVDVSARAEVPVEVTLAANPGGPKPPPTTEKTGDDGGSDFRKIAGYSLLGVAGVGLVVTTVFGLETLGFHSDYTTNNHDGTFGNPTTKSDGVAAGTASDVGLIVAILAGAGACILLFTDLGKDSPPDAKPADPKPSDPKPAAVRWSPTAPGLFRF